MKKWHNRRSYRREKDDDMTHEKKEGEMYLTGKKARTEVTLLQWNSYKYEGLLMDLVDFLRGIGFAIGSRGPSETSSSKSLSIL